MWSYLALVTLILLKIGKIASQAVSTGGIPLTFPCYDLTWSYIAENGRCYSPIQRGKSLKWDDAKEVCETYFRKQSTAEVQLVTFHNEAQVQRIIKLLLQDGNMGTIWTAAHRTATADFFWPHETKPVDFSYFDWSGGHGSGDCIELIYHTSPESGNNTWKPEYTVENRNCEQPKAFYCEHQVPQCTSPPGNFQSDTMEMWPAVPTPQAKATAVCKPGAYMDTTVGSKKDGPDVRPGLEKKEYYCTGQRFEGSQRPVDPMKFETRYQYSGYDVTNCNRLQCFLFPQVLENVVSSHLENETSELQVFEFNHTLLLNCTRGFVNQLMPNSTQTTTTCLQSTGPTVIGIWTPALHQLCVAVRCSDKELESMVPRNGQLSSARNRYTGQIFGSQQISQFNMYGNIISVTCNPGFLYPDRNVFKEVLCDLKEGSEKEGVYSGYAGTVLNLPEACIETTCMPEPATIKPDFNMKPYFLTINASGVMENLTKHNGKPYALSAVIHYFCLENYETVNQESSLNITCSSTGLWSPQLIGCIGRFYSAFTWRTFQTIYAMMLHTCIHKYFRSNFDAEKTAEIPTSTGGRFDGVKEEARSAKQLSSVMFILVFIILGFIVLLDLTTIGRDARSLFTNVKLQHKRYVSKTRKRSKDEVSEDSHLRSRSN